MTLPRLMLHADVLKITAVADDVGDRQGNVASGEITDDSKPLISGIGEAGNTVYVYISFFEDDGKLELDYSSRGVLDYVKVEVVGSDTVISIDRDGQGGQHGFTQVVTLADVQTDLVTLLQNNQIMM